MRPPVATYGVTNYHKPVVGRPSETMTPPGRAFDVAVRRLMSRSQSFKRLVKSPTVQFVIQTARATRNVRQPFRFVFGQLTRKPLADYRLRENELLVGLRHTTTDVHILNEIFHDRIYEFPPSVARMLESRKHPLRVLDLGGHIGLFGAFVFGRFPDAYVTALEPDEGNAAVFRHCIRINRLDYRWNVIEAAAANVDGKLTFLPGHSHSSRVVTEHVDRSSLVRAIDVFPLLGDIDLLKIDIEGSEWLILTDPRFREVDVPVVTLEFHPSPKCPSPDPCDAALDVFRAAGYAVSVNRPQGTLWAWRPPTASPV